MAPAEKAFAEAWWNLAITGSEEAQGDLVRAGQEYNKLFSDPEEHALVAGWFEGRTAIDDELLRRQVEVLHRTYASRRGDPEVLNRIEELEARANAVYSNHRGVVGGRSVGENEVREILRASPDEAVRREAWEASKTVGREVEGTIRELARLRNDLAREAGYPDHYHRALDLQEMDVAELEELMASLEATTEGPFRDLKGRLDARLEEEFGVEAVMPWHLSDPFFQEPPEDRGFDVDRFFEGKDLETLTRETYDALGLDIRGVVAKSDLYAREGKNQHAFCLPVGRDFPYDVRVLANLRAGKPDAYWMGAMLHEFGHAVYDRHINPRLPYLLRGVSHIAMTEAVALMMGALAEEPGWLRAVAGASGEDLAGVAERLVARRRENLLVFTRWALVVFRFEKELYADPDREDLGEIWWDLVERIQGVARPPGRDEPDWAAKIHIATVPVYYQNYVLGNLIAAQLRDYLEETVTRGPFYENEVSGRYLLESFFGPGARENWRDTVLRATGEPLDPRHFVESLRP